MAAPEAAAAIDPSAHPIYISVISAAPREIGGSPASLIRFRARAKHSEGSESQEGTLMAMSTATPDASATTPVVMTNDGTHTFVAPTDGSPLLSWLYKSVIGTVLELFGL
ncbi:hypothetical protein FBU31_007674 [Coemansia sp. 'formosensis']|nr:hypothetical protein FBU31_007674 [Coemansia sp. 'formosensis']